MTGELSFILCYSSWFLSDSSTEHVTNIFHTNREKTMTGELLKQPLPHDKKQGFSGTQVLGIVVGAMFIAIVATVFAIKIFFFSGPFTPVQLSPGEAQQLAEKIEKVEGFSNQAAPKKNEYAKDGTLLPEQYSEEGASRRINFTERELNAMIANNTELAEKLAVKLADNMVSIKLLIPLDPDLPMLGGKTLRVKRRRRTCLPGGQTGNKTKGYQPDGSAHTQCLVGRYQKYRPYQGIWCKQRFLENLCRRSRLHQRGRWFSESSTQRVTIERPLSGHSRDTHPGKGKSRNEYALCGDCYWLTGRFWLAPVDGACSSSIVFVSGIVKTASIPSS